MFLCLPVRCYPLLCHAVLSLLTLYFVMVYLSVLFCVVNSVLLYARQSGLRVRCTRTRSVVPLFDSVLSAILFVYVFLFCVILCYVML